MKKYLSMLLIIILSASFLIGCKSEEVVYVVANAEILEIDEENKSFLVKGIGENSILGDKSQVSTEGAEYIELVEGETIGLGFEDFSVGDRITVDIVEVAESYPTQTSTERVQMIDRAKEEKDPE